MYMFNSLNWAPIRFFFFLITLCPLFINDLYAQQCPCLERLKQMTDTSWQGTSTSLVQSELIKRGVNFNKYSCSEDGSTKAYRVANNIQWNGALSSPSMVAVYNKLNKNYYCQIDIQSNSTSNRSIRFAMQIQPDSQYSIIDKYNACKDNILELAQNLSILREDEFCANELAAWEGDEEIYGAVFPDSDSRVYIDTGINNEGKLGSSDFEISFYVKTDGQERRAVIVNQRTTCNASNPFWNIDYRTSGKVRLEIFSNKSPISKELDLNIDDGLWHNVKLLRNNNTIKFFYDGQEKYSKDVDNDMTIDSAANILIGKGPCATGDGQYEQTFRGIVDDFKIAIDGITIIDYSQGHIDQSTNTVYNDVEGKGHGSITNYSGGTGKYSIISR